MMQFGSKMMKAWVLPKPAPIEKRPLKFLEKPRPVPRNNEILIKVSVCGICRTDLHVTEGDLPVRLTQVTPGHQIVGCIAEIGKTVSGFSIGQRVGVAWLHKTCRKCLYCLAGRENLCEAAEFTGWTRDGGFAEYVVAAPEFVYPLPDGFSDIQAAPLLCAGIIGYRALKLTNLNDRDGHGKKLGIYGFGAAGHVSIQLARARGAEVFVMTRDRERHQALARELGATWIGDTFDEPPARLDASIIFAPAGEIVPVALKALNKGGSLILGGIYMTPIPEFDYNLIYGERVIRSVANNTREDGLEFLREAASIPVKTSVETFSLSDANDALIALKHDSIKGAGVLIINS